MNRPAKLITLSTGVILVTGGFVVGALVSNASGPRAVVSSVAITTAVPTPATAAPTPSSAPHATVRRVIVPLRALALTPKQAASPASVHPAASTTSSTSATPVTPATLAALFAAAPRAVPASVPTDAPTALPTPTAKPTPAPHHHRHHRHHRARWWAVPHVTPTPFPSLPTELLRPQTPADPPTRVAPAQPEPHVAPAAPQVRKASPVHRVIAVPERPAAPAPVEPRHVSRPPVAHRAPGGTHSGGPDFGGARR